MSDSVRLHAARTVDRVMRTGAYSNVVVHATDLGGVDRSRHQALVFATLRWILVVDKAIQDASTRRLASLDPMVLSVLRVAGTELLVLNHAAHGVVDGAAETIRQVGKAKAVGFVNAVARSIASNEPPPLRAIDSFPAWMPGALVGNDIPRLLGALNEPAPVGIRLRSGDVPDQSVTVEGILGAYYCPNGEDVATLEQEGRVDVVDPATTAVVLAAQAQPGMRVLDVAAAPGGKTRGLADAVGETGAVFAGDIHARRLRRAQRRSAGFPNVSWVGADGRKPPFRERSFDLVLIDAPCTGLGTVRRRPEIRHRISADAPSRYGELQRQLIEASLPLVRPGGRLVYSVCTLFPEETVDVASQFGGVSATDLPGLNLDSGTLLRPDLTGTDGMFISIVDR